MKPLFLSFTFALGVTLFLATAACSKPEESAKKPAAPVRSTEITSEMKPGGEIDLVFGIEQQDVTADGSRVLRVGGTYKGAPVGLIVALAPNWDVVAPSTKSKFVFHTGAVEYRTIGDASNTLLGALDELCATNLKPAALRTSTKFAGTSLQGDPADLGKGEVRLKLEFESSDPARQVELYTSIDLPKHLLHIREKSAEQRAALIHALAKD